MEKRAQRRPIGAHGEMCVLLDKYELHAGDAVTGSVQLHVTKPLPRAKLTVRLSGCERMNWGSVETRSLVADRPSWQFLDRGIVFNGPDAEWAVGDYAYPFAFDIPIDSPHSFQFKCPRIDGMEDVCVDVKYRATVRLEADGGLTEADVPFAIAPEALARPVEQPITVTETDAVKAVGFIKSGTCSVTLETTADVISPVDVSLGAVVKLDLDTKRRLKYVDVTLFEDIVVDWKQKYLPGIHRTSSPVSTIRLEVPPTQASSLKLELSIPLGSVLNKSDTPVFPTMTTQFLSIGYRVEADCQFSSLASAITVDAPITMVWAPPPLSSPRSAQND